MMPVNTEAAGKKRQRDLLQEFSSNVTLHGFRYLVEEKGIRRVIWFVITTGSFILSIVLFQSILEDYLSYKTTTTTNSVFDKTNADFPTITICPMNYISMSKLQNLPGNITVNQFMRAFINSGIQHQSGNITDPETAYVLEQLEKENITSYIDIAQLFQLDLDEMMVNDTVVDELSIFHYCTFEGKPCFPLNFTTVETWDTKLCSQFNPYNIEKPSLVSTGKGLGNGLMVTLNLHAEDSIFSEYSFDGVFLTLTTYGNQYQIAEHTEKLILPVGSLSLIEVAAKKTKLLPSPFPTHCGTKEYILIKDRPYSKAMCKLDCYLEFLYSKCGCVGFDVQELVDVKTCTMEEYPCYNKARQLVRQDDSNNCEQKCPQECSNTKYQINHSEAKLGTNRNYYNLIHRSRAWRNKSKEEVQRYIRNNLISLVITFSDFVEIQEVVSASVSLTTLVGTIGGFLGLCLGFSVVTAMEFVFFIFDYFILLRWRKSSDTKK